MVVPELPRRSGPQSSSDSQTESTENIRRWKLKQVFVLDLDATCDESLIPNPF